MIDQVFMWVELFDLRPFFEKYLVDILCMVALGEALVVKSFILKLNWLEMRPEINNTILFCSKWNMNFHQLNILRNRSNAEGKFVFSHTTSSVSMASAGNGNHTNGIHFTSLNGDIYRCTGRNRHSRSVVVVQKMLRKTGEMIAFVADVLESEV